MFRILWIVDRIIILQSIFQFLPKIQSIGDAAINSCKTRRVRDTNSNRRPTFVHVQSSPREFRLVREKKEERHECGAKLMLALVRSFAPRGILEAIHVNRVSAVKEGPFSG